MARMRGVRAGCTWVACRHACVSSLSLISTPLKPLNPHARCTSCRYARTWSTTRSHIHTHTQKHRHAIAHNHTLAMNEFKGLKRSFQVMLIPSMTKNSEQRQSKKVSQEIKKITTLVVLRHNFQFCGPHKIWLEDFWSRHFALQIAFFKFLYAFQDLSYASSKCIETFLTEQSGDPSIFVLSVVNSTDIRIRKSKV